MKKLRPETILLLLNGLALVALFAEIEWRKWSNIWRMRDQGVTVCWITGPSPLSLVCLALGIAGTGFAVWEIIRSFKKVPVARGTPDEG